MRRLDPSGEKARMSARSCSAGWVSGSSTLEPEPMPTNMVLPSRENWMSRVQWLRLAGRSAMRWGWAEAVRSPLW